MCCSKEPICAGHLKPRMFMASVLEAGRKPDTDPHLFTRWSLPCSSLVSPSLFPSPSVCLFPSLSVLPLSGGLCAAHKDGPACIPSCASGAMNCLITAATLLPEHPSSAKQNFLSVWNPRLHFHICIFLLLLSFFLLISFLPVLSHRGRGTHNAPLFGGGRQGNGASANGFPWPCPQGEADSPSHYP